MYGFNINLKIWKWHQPYRCKQQMVIFVIYIKSEKTLWWGITSVKDSGGKNVMQPLSLLSLIKKVKS